MKAQLTKLLNWFDDKNSVLVALSGGVDSALVAYSAYTKLGKSAIAVTADYKTLAQEELEYAKKISSEIGIKHIVIEYSELDNESFVKNDSNRCFYCRRYGSDKADLRAVIYRFGQESIISSEERYCDILMKILSTRTIA